MGMACTTFEHGIKACHQDLPVFWQLLNIRCDDVCVRKIETCLNSPGIGSSEDESTHRDAMDTITMHQILHCSSFRFDSYCSK